MNIFDDKDAIIGAALGVSGAFDDDKKTDTATAFGAAIGASVGSGKKWTLEDSIKLGATIDSLDSIKNNTNSTNECLDSVDNDINEYNNLVLDTKQEDQLEESGIDTLDFTLMNDGEKRETLENAGLDPFDFDMF